MRRRALTLGALIIATGLSACDTQPHDALARLNQVPGRSVQLPASELMYEGAVQYVIVCPGQTADEVALLGDSGSVPDDGYDSVLNALLSINADGEVSTQKYAREEVDLCPDDRDNSPQILNPQNELMFRKEKKGWVLQPTLTD